MRAGAGVASAVVAFGSEAMGPGIVDREVVAVAGVLEDREYSIYSHSLGDCTLAEREVVAVAHAGLVDSHLKSGAPGQNRIVLFDIPELELCPWQPPPRRVQPENYGSLPLVVDVAKSAK